MYIILPMQNIYANINKIPNIAIDAKDTQIKPTNNTFSKPPARPNP